jgi:hypothetical protein
MFDPFVGSERP